MRIGKVEWFFATKDPKDPMDEIVSFAQGRLPDGWTLTYTVGGFKGETERSYTLTAFLPLDTPAHKSAVAWAQGKEDLIPAQDDTLPDRARIIAEELAREFEQMQVIYSISPVQFAATTSQAGYRRTP